MHIQLLSDKPAKDDLLGREKFARSLAHALVSPANADGLVVGIEGSWGSGKSSVIGFIKRELATIKVNECEPVVVDFNPWMFSGSGALVETLLGQIAAKVGRSTSAPAAALSLGRTILSYGGLFKYLAPLDMLGATGGLGTIVSGAARLAEHIGEASKTGQESLDEVEKLLPKLDLTGKKEEVMAALRKYDRPIVVIVDDVDRLAPEEVRTLVQAIKAVADFPRTTYVLAYDREVVASALGAGNTNAGLAYLEKIVQVVYPIPPLFQYQLKKYIDTRLTELFAALTIELRDFEQSEKAPAIRIVVSLMRHPRDVVRLINRLLLSLPATAYEVNAIDVLVFEALSQRFPLLRERVHQHPDEFIGRGFRGDRAPQHVVPSLNDVLRDTSVGTASIAEPWLRHLPADERESKAAAEACRFLFGSERRTDAKASLGLADPDRLARYFHMTTMEAVLEVQDVHALLLKPAELAIELDTDNIAEADQLLGWIHSYLPSAPAVDSSGCLEVLAALTSKRPMAGSTLTDIVALMIQKADPAARADLLARAAGAFPLVVVEALLSAEAAKLRIGHNEEGAISAAPPLVNDPSLVRRLLENWCGRVRQFGQAGLLVFEPSLDTILPRFAQLHPLYSEVYDLTDQLTASREGMQAFLSTFPQEDDGNLDHYCLVRSADALVGKIRQAGLAGQYDWLLERLRDADVIEAILAQSAHTEVQDKMHEYVAQPTPPDS